MALYKLGDVFGYQDANHIKKLWESTTPPTNAEIGEIYLDTSSSPPKLRRWNGTKWEMVGIGGFQEDSDGCIVSFDTGAVLKFDGGHTRFTTHDGNGHFGIKCGVDENNNILPHSDGAAWIQFYDSGSVQLLVSDALAGNAFSKTNSILVDNNGVFINSKAVPTATAAVHFQYGAVDLPAGSIPITVTFPESFSSIPIVITGETTAVTVIHAVTSRTLSEFVITTHPTISGSVCWVAIGLR